MNKKFCDGCKKELRVYNLITSDKYWNITLQIAVGMTENPIPKFEICEDCRNKVLTALNIPIPKIVRPQEKRRR